MMRVALIQTNTGHDVGNNLSQLKSLLDGAEAADLVVTPECVNIMGYNPNIDLLASEEADQTVNFLRDWARRNKTNLLIGSALLNDPDCGGAVNRQLLIDRAGEIAARYDKIHMFDVDLEDGESYRESERFMAGDCAVVSCCNEINLGHSICFDLRFSRLYRDLALAGAEVLGEYCLICRKKGNLEVV